MFRNANDIIFQLGQAFDRYFVPAINFLYDVFNDFFTEIEKAWYLMFIWIMLNTAFSIWIVVSSFFDWRDIFKDGVIRFALISHVKNKRLRDSEERYQKRKAENRAEAEERFSQRRAEAEERYQERHRIREEASLKRNFYIGEQHFSDEALASAYFNKHPNATRFTYGGKTYWNVRSLESMAKDEFGDDYESNNEWFQYMRRQQNSVDDNE